MGSTKQTPPNAECTSFRADIRPKFTDEDVRHMNEQVGLDLEDYQTVSDNAELILERLRDQRSPMPPRPRGPWTPAWIECFEQWIKSGKRP